MEKFQEALKSYSLTNGFVEIEKKVESDPYYSLILKKEQENHFFYILVDKKLPPDESFSLRVYNKHSESAPRGEYRMKMKEFLNFNDLLLTVFDRIYKDVLNYKPE